MKLYNTDKQEWRNGNFKRGDSWRSDIVYRCEICHTKTNKWVMGGWPGMGPRILCPGDIHQEHEELESLIPRCDTLNSQIQDYEKTLKEATNINRKRAQNMINNLYAQKDLLEVEINKLRERFSGRLDDIVGLDSNAKTEDFYPHSQCVVDEKKSLLEITK